MSRHWVGAASTIVSVLVFGACDGAATHSGATPVALGAAASEGGAGAESKAGAASLGGAGVAGAGGSSAVAGTHAALGGAGGEAAGESPGGNASGGSVTLGGGSNPAGTAGSAGLQTDGGAGWIIPAEPGAGWTGAQDPACPEAIVSHDGACTSPPGTRCSYPESGDCTRRCQCYTSSTGDDRWWCREQWSSGYDLCPAAYPGNGSCPNIGDVTCYYVDAQDELQACNCYFGTVKCVTWGL